MNKSVLIAIQPYWVFLIISRYMGWNIPQHKTIEVRKDFPKDSVWNRVVHIYCSKSKKSFNRIPKEYQPLMEKFLGKVFGEFVCDNIDRIPFEFIQDAYNGDFCGWHDLDLDRMHLHPDDFYEYAKGNNLYGWHISDLKIYDKPKELGEFRNSKGQPIKRPFQSWGYVCTNE